ncbi:MAG: hypothetical protein R3E79_59200 [Caldilineaceae bacterium]
MCPLETGRAAMTWGNPEFVQVLTSRHPPRDNENFVDVALFPMKQQNGNVPCGRQLDWQEHRLCGVSASLRGNFYTSAPILKDGVPSRWASGRAWIADTR